MRRLIVNADDFGLTRGINRAVAGLHGAGALRSATLMAASPRFDEAVAIARQHPGLGVGCHVVLVDGRPLSAAQEVPSLIDPSGNGEMRPRLGAFVRDLSTGRIRSTEIEREAAAQIRRLQQAGITVTHVDTHKHTHMFPAVLEAVLRAAEACGVRAIRNPFEPHWSIRSTPNGRLIRKLEVRLLGRHLKNFREQVRARGFRTTQGCVGVLATGTLDRVGLAALLDEMPEGDWELVCHPAEMDEELRGLRTRLKESRAIELAALASLPELLAGRIEPIHFGDLHPG